MTTAARPTFDPAKGGRGTKENSLTKLTQQLSSKDLPAHLNLKERLQGQDAPNELEERDFKAELEERERIAQIDKSKNTNNHYKFVPSLEQATQVRLALKAERDREREAEKEALLTSESVISTTDGKSLSIVNARKMAQLDADEDFGSDDFSESDFDDEDDEGDDPAELMAELQRIKQERQAEEERKEREQKGKEDRVRSSSRLDDETPSFAVKRRWDDDVPFKNCAREEVDPKRKVYINDTLRQEFHKKFMDKYIR